MDKIGDYGAYFFYKKDPLTATTKDPVLSALYGPNTKRVMLFMYMKSGNKYRYALFDNFVDYPSEDVDKKTVKEALGLLFKEYDMYNADVLPPEHILAIFKEKHNISKFYGLKWFTRNYVILFRQFVPLLKR